MDALVKANENTTKIYSDWTVDEFFDENIHGNM